MATRKETRDSVCVNVEVPQGLVHWMDAQAEEDETTRSGLIRLALKKLRAQREEQKTTDAGHCSQNRKGA